MREPLGEAEVKGAKRFYGWPGQTRKFLVPDGVRGSISRNALASAGRLRAKWEFPARCICQGVPACWQRQNRLMLKRDLTEGWDKNLAGISGGRQGRPDATLPEKR